MTNFVISNFVPEDDFELCITAQMTLNTIMLSYNKTKETSLKKAFKKSKISDLTSKNHFFGFIEDFLMIFLSILSNFSS